MSIRSFADPDTHFRIEESGSPPSVDGMAIHEPKWLVCDECDARVIIDGADGHQTTIDNLPHARSCSQRAVTSEWWMDHYLDN